MVQKNLLDHCKTKMIIEKEFPFDNLTDIFGLGAVRLFMEFEQVKDNKTALRNFVLELIAVKKKMVKQQLMIDNHYGWKDPWKDMLK